MVDSLRSIRLPEAKEEEVVLVRLDDGTVVARTRKEVEAMQAQPKEGGGTP